MEEVFKVRIGDRIQTFNGFSGIIVDFIQDNPNTLLIEYNQFGSTREIDITEIQYSNSHKRYNQHIILTQD